MSLLILFEAAGTPPVVLVLTPLSLGTRTLAAAATSTLALSASPPSSLTLGTL